MTNGAVTPVLLVEDEADVLDTMAELLEKAGYDVVTACDGEDALSDDRIENVDIVVTDVRMPRMDGIALYRATMKTNPGLPFIFMSGHTIDLEDVFNAAQWSKPVLLRKPFP